VLLKELQRHRSLEIIDIRKPIARLRQIKQAPELAALQRAIDITSDALKEVYKKISSYRYENELVADITRSFIHSGAKGHAYDPIVASGLNAATIHYMDCDSALSKNSLILFDVGAEVSNYSADISRTYAYGEQPSA